MFLSKNATRSLSRVLVAMKQDVSARATACLLAVVGLLAVGNESVRADYILGPPTNLGPPVNSSAGEGAPSISADGLALYFVSLRTGGRGAADIWVTTRATVSDPWGEPMNLGSAVNSYAWDGELSISGDGLSLYFGSQRSGGRGSTDIWVTTRETTSDPWGEAVNLGPMVNTPTDDFDVCISTDGLSLYIESNRAGGHGGIDLWVARRATPSDPWGEPVNLGPTINTSASDGAASISADGRMLFFSDFPSPRPGGHGGTDIWVATRATTSDPWGEPRNLGPAVNSSANDQGPNISADGSTLYFFSTRPGGSGNFDLWQVSINPIVDFNVDGIVDSADMCVMVGHWGEDYPLCDVGPTLFGDGIVDVHDLTVLAGYLFQEIDDPTLVAHWALDETEGAIALDSAGDNAGYVMGNPVWQPDNGQVSGAIELDGVDDAIVAGTPLNPADGPFSVFAWIRGGVPGQAIISEPVGPDWLSIDPLTGHLMTELKGSNQDSSPLLAATTVTDGNWHRIGLVWDGSNRTLCVDDVAVAEDTQDTLESPANGFYIGTGKAMAPGTFFSGLIDDVRIYDRAVSP